MCKNIALEAGPLAGLQKLVNNKPDFPLITTLAAHVVIGEGLINIFGSVNYLQTIVSSRATQMAPKVRLRPYRRIKSMGPLNASFEAFAGSVRWMIDRSHIILLAITAVYR